MDETISIIIDDFIQNNLMMLSVPQFEEELKKHTLGILTIQFDGFGFNLEEEYENGKKNFYISYPQRCSGNTYETPVDIDLITKKLDYLDNVYQPEQKSDEWYLFRQNYITASSAWKAFGSDCKKNELIYEKCQPINIEKYKPNLSESPLTWGIKYEDVSIMIYEKLYSTSVKDYGCIPHKDYAFIAASPDGINNIANTSRYGRMLEIKNIVNRKIDGNPKPEYWIQMQLQMEVCDLDECDFLETQFIEYENESEFKKDGTFHKTADGKQKGMLLYFVKNGGPLYEYAPLNINEEDFEVWSEEMKEKNKEYPWISTIYWKLDICSCVLVLRNKDWFKQARPLLQELWESVIHDRKNGYEHRAPKKQTTKKTAKKTGCLISIDI